MKDSAFYALSKLDWYGYKPALRVNGNSIYQTIFGGILVLIYIFTSLIGILYFASIMWNKKEASVIVSTYDIPSYPIPINNENFNIYVSIQDPITAADFADKRIFSVKAIHKLIINDHGNMTFSESEIPIDTCNNFYSSISEISNDTTFDLRNYYCLKPNIGFLQGYWGAEVNSYVKIYITKCVNTTEDSSCFSDEIIQSKLGFISYYIRNNLVYSSNYTNPIYNVLIDHFNVLSSQLTYNIVFYAKILEYSTDNGFLLENISEIKTFFVEEPMYMYYLNRPNVISIIELKSDRIGQVIRRSYIKIQDVATRIGGLSKILAMIVSVISYYYSLVNYELNLADMILKHSSDVHEVNHTLGVQTLQTMNNDISNRKVPKNNFIGSQSTLKVKLDSNVTNSMKTRFHFVITRLICMMDSSNMGKLIKRIREKEFQCLSVNNLIEKMHTLDVMTRLMLKDKAFGTELLEIFYNNLIKRSKEHNGPMPNTNIFNIGKDDLIGFV